MVMPLIAGILWFMLGSLKRSFFAFLVRPNQYRVHLVNSALHQEGCLA
jgi:hypothetical protein